VEDGLTHAGEKEMAKHSKRFEIPHSPAPWRWSDDGGTLLDAQGRTIVTISDLARDEDANLLVAAPALVAACRQVLTELHRFGPADEGVEHAMEALRDALLFAKYGEAPDLEAPDLFDDLEDEAPQKEGK
jgi:hypothetical protein